MTLTPRQASASLPTDEATGEATRDHFRAKFVRAYREQEESDKLGPATLTAEDAWLNHDHEFNEAVVLLRAYLRQRGYQIGGR